ncbi:hypothetical protein FEM48_Zijuj11G0033800 [Ziziphus jujuba var. spinosa]|uniref:Neprosin PEP catalytic domain-containing protein n=1 Tax=Ziziphus jujuba var. spinosa TaxID=714518 RepID=A0A978UGI7_ZIZJJ|nr:hypothetical protein FEM48_Zijuj11G0033800 [Ziziphus jujuba var. spinosa]
MQTALDFKKIIIFIMLATICVIRGAETVEEWEKLSKEEELELDRQLKLINKPAIKSFQNPGVKVNQFSIASMSIANGRKEQMNKLGGKLINIYIQMGADFIPIGLSKIHLGLNLHPVSVYNGPQFDIAASIHQDYGTKNWLLMFFDEYVGYWPKEIISNMAGGGDHISWGGEVYSIITELSPAMGSGHFPPECWGKAAYVDEIQVIRNGPSEYKDPNKHSLKFYADATHCYDVKEGVNQDSHYILLGVLEIVHF